MAPRMTEKRAQALRIRDACLALADEHGEDKRVAGVPVRMTEFPDVAFWLSRSGPNRRNLDIWREVPDQNGFKVMNISWTDGDNDTLTIKSFRRGLWEQDLLARLGGPSCS